MMVYVATSVATLAAQEPRRLAQPDSVPIDLATALMAAGTVGSEPQILVGTLPEWFAQRIVLPPGARILGSAFQGTAVVGIASVPGTASESLLAGVRRELLSHGWKNPPAPPSYGGFRPATMAPGAVDLTRVMLCGSEDQSLTVFATPHHGISTTITYRVGTYAAYGPCRAQPVPQYARPQFPMLYNPPSTSDQRMTGMCEQSAGGGSGTMTAFRGAMSAEDILDRYARQLADSGWTVEGRSASIVGRTWTRPDSTGAPVRLSLVVTTPARDSTCHEVNMQVRTEKKP
jgi:hypothetical protein